MARFVIEYSDGEADGRLDAPSFHKNYLPFVDVLKAELGEASGHLLEIGSGTGQHAVVYAATFPDLTIWPTDYNSNHVESIAAWRRHNNLDNLRPPRQLDATSVDWLDDGAGQPPQELAAMVSLNMVHISPISVAEGLFRGAGKYLNSSGKLVLYGPFKRDGRHTAPSNAAFDASLQAQDPAWGVRDISELEAFATQNGLALDRLVEMPSNNLTLIFTAA